MKRLRFAITLAALSLAPAGVSPLPAEGRQQEAAVQPKRDEPKAKPPEEKLSHTSHRIRVNGQELQYTATTGTLVLKQEDGTPRAGIFFIAYTKDGVDDLSARPVTFSFNGGPGSSSVWLHMGTLGPKRVLMADDDGNPTPPPYRIVDNEYTILDKTDLVFIDPVSTGYSRAASEKDAKKFHGVQEDVESMGEFIRLYTTRYRRWASPKYLAGESYGTTRAAALSGHLQSQLGMNLNGVILISAILNFQTARFDHGNDLPYPLFLPTYTATAWYHRKLPRELQGDLRKTLDEVERFAAGEYTVALMKGDRLPAEERAQVVKKLARYTGLSPDYIESANLRVGISRFVKELLRSERRTVGRFDSRYKGIDRDAAGEGAGYDPSYSVVQGAYTAALNHYLRSELRFDTDLPYEILTARVRPWNYAPYENRYLNVAETLREAMTQNPNLRVYLGKGYYDLATPYFAAEYTMAHLHLDESLRDNIVSGYYDAGHMFYVHKPSLIKLKKELDAFLR